MFDSRMNADQVSMMIIKTGYNIHKGMDEFIELGPLLIIRRTMENILENNNQGPWKRPENVN